MAEPEPGSWGVLEGGVMGPLSPPPPAQVSLGLPGCPQERGPGGRSPESLGRLQ